MYVISPVVITIVAALVGMLVLPLVMRKQTMKTRLWGIAGGGVAGALGTQVFMAPLGYCTFESERFQFALFDPEAGGLLPRASVLLPVDLIFGIILIAVGMALVLWLAHWTVTRLTNGQSVIPTPEFYPGAFNTRLAPLYAFVFLLPTLVVLSIFHYYPLGQTFRLSTRLVRLGAPRTVFRCVENFTTLFTNPDYYYTLFITFVIAIGVVIVSMTIGLLIAQMANMPIKGANVYRALLIWPVAISPVVAGVLFQLMLNPITGVVNHILESIIGIEIQWFGQNVPLALTSIIMTAAWNQSGFNILFYIAGLQNIPKELLEASYIDGANPFQAFFRITFPLLSPFTFFLIVTNTIYAFFQTFGVIDVLTGGGPVRATSSAMYLVYQIGIQGKSLGAGAAQSIVLFVLVVFITVVQFRTSSDRITYGV